MSAALPASDIVITVQDLALRLLAGQHLTKCHGIGWIIGPDAAPVGAGVVRALANGFRLVPAGDALPGFAASLSQTLLVEPLLSDDDLLARLRPAVRKAGSLGAYARQYGIGKSSVAMVEGAHCDMTKGVAATLGMEPHPVWRAIEPKRRTATAPEAA